MNKELIISIIGSIFATFLIGILVFLYNKLLRVFREQKEQSERLEEAIHPITEYRDLYSLSDALIKALESYDEDYSRAIIFRALPCEFSSALTEQFNENKGNINRNMRKVERMIDEIVIQGSEKHGGAWDVSLFGRTGLDKIDTETLNYINRLYFSHQPPATSSLALHENFNEVGLILLGKTKSKNINAISEWKFGFMIFYSGDFSRMMGAFRFNNHRHIEPLEEIFRMKYNEAGVSHELDAKTEKNEGMKEKVSTFYRSVSDC